MMTTQLNQQLQALIRNIPDFPKLGIQFKDITPLLKHADVVDQTVTELIQPFSHQEITDVVGIEARGFIFGSLVAAKLGVSFVPLRKPNKLPYHTNSVSYDLEYGQATLEIHQDALDQHSQVLVIDDLLATGGTAHAACQLIDDMQANIVGLSFVIELNALAGRSKLANHDIHSLIQY